MRPKQPAASSAKLKGLAACGYKVSTLTMSGLSPGTIGFLVLALAQSPVGSLIIHSVS